MTNVPARALSILQPWPWRIFHEGKDVENRNWWTAFRGPVLVHASKGIDRSERDAITPDMKRGGIVGVMNIVDCVRESNSKWFCGDYGFVIEDARELPFIPCKGALGFWRVPQDVRDQLEPHFKKAA